MLILIYKETRGHTFVLFSVSRYPQFTFASLLIIYRYLRVRTVFINKVWTILRHVDIFHFTDFNCTLMIEIYNNTENSSL